MSTAAAFQSRLVKKLFVNVFQTSGSLNIYFPDTIDYSVLYNIEEYFNLLKPTGHMMRQQV